MVNRLERRFSDHAVQAFTLKPLLAAIKVALTGGLILGSSASAQAELPVPAQVWATMGSAGKQITGNTLQINQHTDKAVLNWESFNVGAKNRVDFKQPTSSSIALNRIFQDDPSRILGKVTANGQLYLFNKNGFVFGKNSTVDTNTLVASALNISDETFKNGGIANTFNQTKGAALEGAPDNNAAITVEKGAKVQIGENGRLIMAAPNVNNAGELKADKFGQIILVGSKDKVYLQPADSNSPFAGLSVEVGTGGKVTNLGNVLARQGNITLAGFAVNQAGRLSATTSVNVNGSIRLLAREGQSTAGDKLVGASTTRTEDAGDGLGTESKVTFEKGSITEIVADREGGKAIDEQKQPDSYLETSANNIHMKSGSAIGVPSGRVEMIATDNLVNPGLSQKGRIEIDKGASIDVSGSKSIDASVERNVVDVPVQSFELRDSPYQKGGVLQGQTVRVDIRDKNLIIDTSGALARIERSIDERLGTGGRIAMSAGESVDVDSGAEFNISGGVINYKPGFINTTKLLTAYGQFVDIGDADPAQHYVGVFGQYIERHEKWGFERVWQNDGLVGKGRFEPGYKEGLDAGALDIATANLSWRGNLVAGAASGFYQRESTTRPYGGEFAVDLKTFNSTQNVVIQGKPIKNIDDDDKANDSSENTQDRALVFDAGFLKRSRIQKFSVKTLGDATIASDADIVLMPSGQFDLISGDIDFKGDFYSAGGSLRLGSGFDFDETDAALRNFDPNGKLTLHDGSSIDVSGRWINDFAQGLDKPATEAVAIDGGSVTAKSTGDLTVAGQAQIEADSGAWLTQSQTLTAGKAGSIDLAAVGNGSEASGLRLDGRLFAHGLDGGGKLSLGSGKIVIGKADQTSQPGQDVLYLGVDNQGAFDIGGIDSFGSIALTGNSEDLILSKNTTLNLQQRNQILNDDYLQTESGRSVLDLSSAAVLPAHLRKPVDLALSAKSDVKLKTGSQILTDNGATIDLTSNQGGIFVDGLISAPAGAINLTIDAAPVPYSPTQSIWLGRHADLQAKGGVVLQPVDGSGRRDGEVMAGGNVSLLAKRGYVVLEKGSKIDVSGAKAMLDVRAEDGIGSTRTEIASDGGKISLTAAEGGVLDGELTGLSGNSTTQGGRLDIAINRANRRPDPEQTELFPFGPIAVNVRQDHVGQLAERTAYGDDLDSLGLNGKVDVSSEAIMQGGFDDLRLSAVNVNNSNVNDESGRVNFIGDVTLSAKADIDIDAPIIAGLPDSTSETGTVTLNTAHFSAGSSLIRQTSTTPQIGANDFSVNAEWIDFRGGSVWNGFSELNFKSEHDIRANGLLEIDRTVDGKQNSDYVGGLVTAGNMKLTASQLYPTTLTKFKFAVENNPQGKITFEHSGQIDRTPLSAAGTLTVQAPFIEQNGTVKAPFGKLQFTAEKSLSFGTGSLTSVSGEGQLIPFGGTFSGLDWLYRLDNTNLLNFSTPPEKKIVLDAPKVVMKKGSVSDLSGGGDLLAHEFQPGIGGSFDYLDPASPTYGGGYAIVPGLGSSIAPYDPLLSAGFGLDAGSQVYLSASNVLPAGFYTLLPARYALLPGAFLITPQAGTLGQRVATVNAAGLQTVAGYRVNSTTGVKDSRWSGFLIETGADIRKHSQYDEQQANDFYTQQALRNGTSLPLLSRDSGQMVVKNVETQLVLEGDFKTSAQGGRGARLDIAAERLKIVGKLNARPVPGILEILAEDLSKLKVDSLLLGGERSIDNSTGETSIAVGSREIEFERGANVTATDLIAVAKENLHVKNGASITSSGQVNTGDSQLNVDGDGALLRVSADRQVQVNRTGSAGAGGDLSIDAGATLSATKAIVIDASRNTALSGDIQLRDGSLNLSANQINIGSASVQTAGALNLSNEDLKTLDVAELVLNSRNTVHFYGDVGIRNANGGYDPIAFDQLLINAAGFSGHGRAGQSINLEAETLTLQNAFGREVKPEHEGHGLLNISARTLRQGEGVFGVSGFKAVNVAVQDGFQATGNGKLTSDSDLTLKSGYITAGGGTQMTIDASGHAMNVIGNGMTSTPESAGFGGSLTLIADRVDFDGRALLPSGKLTIDSLTGDLKVGANGIIDLSGSPVRFGDVLRYTPGGSFAATAEQGKVVFAEGSLIDIGAGHSGVPGGVLTISAIKQYADLSGAIKAENGSVSFDVAGFMGAPDSGSASSGFDLLVDKLKDAGISETFSVRSRNDAIVQTFGHNITANAISLSSDKGNVELAGTLNADGDKHGGKIEISAGEKVILQDRAELSARAKTEDGDGGKVILSSTNTDDPDDKIHGIDILANSKINVAGGKNGTGGKVLLRALRTDNNGDGFDDGVAIGPILGKVEGASQFFAEGVKKYANDNFVLAGEIHAGDIDSIKLETDNYMAQTAAGKVSTSLGQGIRLRPGIEIDYTGDLTLKEMWNFADWKYFDETGPSALAGGLTINTTGNFTVEKALTDGFKTDFILTGEVKDILQTDDSWSYRLTAGADLSSASATVNGLGGKQLTLATNPDASPDFPDPFFQHDTVIRTGTGDIQLAASGDIVFQDRTSVYSAGKADADNRYGTFGDNYVGFLFYGDYATSGGDLTLNAGRDIRGALSQSPFISQWLVRQGNNWADHQTDRQATAWAVDFVKFSQNAGSFGGGQVDIQAGNDIDDLMVMLPTTGKQVGELTDPANEFSQPKTNVVEINGGGRLKVNAGNNIVGGVYYVGRGRGELTAGGSIKGSSEPVELDTTLRGLTKGPQLLLGDGQFTLSGNGDVSIAAVTDPMLLGTSNPLTGLGDTNFFSYGAQSGLILSSLSGDIHIGADPSVILSSNINFSEGQSALAKIMPASLDSTAFGGDLLIDGKQTDLILFPSAQGQLNLLAEGEIAGAETGLQRLGMSDYDPALLPDLFTPSDGVNLTRSENNIVAALNPFGNGTLVHAQQPVHATDPDPVRIVTREGDIQGLQFNLPKRAIVTSGQDLSNTFLQIQHVNSGDASIISAGRDIIYQTERDPDFGTLKLNTNRIEVAGEGNVLVKAGRNIDLGTSAGLSTVGNTLNPNLPAGGANLTLLAGLNGEEPDFLGLQNLAGDILKYAENYTEYQTLVTDFMRRRTGNDEMTVKTAFEQFNLLKPGDYASLQPKFEALQSDTYQHLIDAIKQEIVAFVRRSEGNPSLGENEALKQYTDNRSSDKYLPVQPKLNELANQILFGELNATGSASAADPTRGNERGFAAIQALYPDDRWNGDINLFFSKVQTLKDGDINLLAPGGNVNAGLAVVANDLQKEASDLGIVAQGKGDINAFLHDDFIVNQSRVFALGGGDITIWSSEGDIDAGRGAKSAIAAPPPEITFDESGNLVVTFPPIVSGSGIRTAAPIGSGREAGNVALFAPGGIVNAGEAGIGGNNVTISATAVLGANNIQVGGVGTGVPAASTVSLAAGLTGVSNLSASVNQMAQATTGMTNNNDDKAKKRKRLRSIVVKLLGFGT